MPFRNWDILQDGVPRTVSGWLAGGWRREEIRRHKIVQWKEPKELTEGYNLSAIFWPIVVYILETSMCILDSCSCLQCNPGCRYSYDWTTLIRNKTKMWLLLGKFWSQNKQLFLLYLSSLMDIIDKEAFVTLRLEICASCLCVQIK